MKKKWHKRTKKATKQGRNDDRKIIYKRVINASKKDGDGVQKRNSHKSDRKWGKKVTKKKQQKKATTRDKKKVIKTSKRQKAHDK